MIIDNCEGAGMKIIDMHCDTIRECFLRNEGIRENSLCVDLERMKKNNAAAQFFAIWLSERCV